MERSVPLSPYAPLEPTPISEVSRDGVRAGREARFVAAEPRCRRRPASPNGNGDPAPGKRKPPTWAPLPKALINSLP